MFENINEVAVLVSGIVAVAIGNIWYSPMLFGKELAKSEDNYKEDRPGLKIAVFRHLLVYIVIFFLLGKLINLGEEIESASLFKFISLVVLMLWAHMLAPVIWEKKTLQYFFIHAVYVALVLFVGLGIIIYWPW